MVAVGARDEDRADGRIAVHARSTDWSSPVFAPSMAIPRFGHRRASGTATKVASAVAQFALVIAFAIAGTIFLGLAIASPVVVPIAHRQGVALSGMDLATARELGSVWWLFAIGGILSFGGALATLGNLMQRLATPPEA